MKPITIIIILIVVALLGWVVFYKPTVSGIKENTSEVQPSKTSEDNTTTKVEVQIGAEKEFIITGSNFSFAPKQISVKKGDKVKITFVNSNGTHDLKIDEFKVSTKRINGGEQDVVTFIADKAGSFQYYCSIGSHRQMGMWGTLTVSE